MHGRFEILFRVWLFVRYAYHYLSLCCRACAAEKFEKSFPSHDAAEQTVFDKQESTIKMIRDVAKLHKQRLAMEERYAREMASLHATATKLSATHGAHLGATLTAAWDAYANDLNTRAETHKQMVADWRNDVLAPIQLVAKSCETQVSVCLICVA